MIDQTIANLANLVLKYDNLEDKVNEIETSVTNQKKTISEINSNLQTVTSKYSGMKSISPGEKASFQLESISSYIITVMKLDEAIAGNTDGTSQSSFIATTTSNRASLCAIHNNSGIATSVVNRTVTLNNSTSGYVLQYTVVKLN